MRVIMTGGGTGGHIYPAIAIADKIEDRHPILGGDGAPLEEGLMDFMCIT